MCCVCVCVCVFVSVCVCWGWGGVGNGHKVSLSIIYSEVLVPKYRLKLVPRIIIVLYLMLYGNVV